MRLASHVVVMAVDDGLVGGDLRPRHHLAHRGHDVLHHDLAVDLRIGLRPVDRIHVVVEVIGALIEPSERGIGQPDLPSKCLLAGDADEARGHDVAHAARTRMEHHAHDAVCIRGEFDEVVARSQASELAPPGHGHHALEEFGMTVEKALHAFLEGLRAVVTHGVGPPLGHADGHVPQNRLVDSADRAVVKVTAPEVESCKAHAAADVDADGARDDGAFGRDHAAYGGAQTCMNVGHRRDVMKDERQRGRVEKLLTRLVVERLRPDVNRDASFASDDGKGRHGGTSTLVLFSFS